MGYICMACGEGLPDEEICPCTMMGDDLSEPDISGPLTSEVASTHSPVRQFLDESFTAGLRDVQRRYREAAPALVVAAAPKADVNPGTVGTAADWLLRFLVCPEPDLQLAQLGALACSRGGIDLEPALAGIADLLGVPLPALTPEWRDERFTGPVQGSGVPPELLATACWALALLTEAGRGGPRVAVGGPLGRLGGTVVTVYGLLSLAPAAGLYQLSRFREVFETALLPQLASRAGEWALGPTFTGSALLNADADLIAAGLLLDLKTSAKKAALNRVDVFQLIGYALLDFDDEFHLDEVAIFSARYAYFTSWGLNELLSELVGYAVSLPRARDDFRRLLTAHARPAIARTN